MVNRQRSIIKKWKEEGRRRKRIILYSSGTGPRRALLMRPFKESLFRALLINTRIHNSPMALSVSLSLLQLPREESLLFSIDSVLPRIAGQMQELTLHFCYMIRFNSQTHSTERERDRVCCCYVSKTATTRGRERETFGGLSLQFFFFFFFFFFSFLSLHW